MIKIIDVVVDEAVNININKKIYKIVNVIV